MKKLFLSLAVLFVAQLAWTQVLDDIVKRKVMKERQVLAYAPLREADLFWEKRIWRVIDVRQKMNQTFTYPQAPFFKLLTDAAAAEEISLYSAENDRFEYPLNDSEVDAILFRTDTIDIYHPETLEPELKVIRTELNWEDVVRFRIKEQWYFDEARSELKVRILGIAPMIEVRDDHGNFRYEKPLFWAYYPELRPVLAKQKVFNPNNDQHPISWEDQMERRYFSSYIYKKSNIHDERLQDIYTGVDLLLEADKIKQEIFNFEHDLWSY
ncbi:MAG: gliding motility protein GldN [Bacteroidota bacterium]